MVSPQDTSRYPEERRLVTVMFAVIQGLNALVERVELDTVREVVREAWPRLEGVILQQGGYISKHMSDVVMAVWGVPTLGENDAERAVKAALEVQKIITDYTKSAEKPGLEGLKLRVGLHTGPAYAGYVGMQNDYTVMGEVVNIAFRLADMADAEAVLITDTTYQAVRGAFQVRKLPPVQLRGVAKLVEPYLVQDVQATSGRARYGSLDSLQTRMVGRAADVDRVGGLYQQILRSGQPGMVLVTGEPGIGKSRLLMEFAGLLESNSSSFYLMSARALAQTAQVPFYVWKLIWYNRFGIQLDDSPALANEKFLREFQRVWGRTLGPVPLLEAAHLVGSLLGLEWPNSPYLAPYANNPQGRVERAFELTGELMRRIATSRPTMLMLDDLQWMDQDSLKLLLFLLKNPSKEMVPLFILAGTNPEFLDSPAGEGKIADLGQVVTLGPLPVVPESVTGAYPSLTSLPEHVLSPLVRYSRGNPYFLEEIVRMLLKTGEDDSEAVLYETLARLHAQPPESLTAMLKTRLGDLPRLARAAAMLASVSGRVFWVGGIEAAVRAFVGKRTDLHLTVPSVLAGQSIQEGLRLLVKAELAFPRANSTYSSEQEYIFKHDLLRDAAYSLIPAGYRTQYHLAVGYWLLNHSTPDFKIMAADQFEAAGAFADVVIACEQAVELFSQRGAHGEAQMLTERMRQARALSAAKQPGQETDGRAYG